MTSCTGSSISRTESEIFRFVLPTCESQDMLEKKITHQTMIVTRKKPEQWQPIACQNWPEEYSYAPDVKFRMWHDDVRLHIEFQVSEKTTKAEQTVPGGPVYMDSCVECFIQPDGNDPHYYNFEWNAAGRLAMACRTERNDPEPAPLQILASVDSKPSLGSEPFPEHAAGPWSLEVTIPAAALFHAGVHSWSGKQMRMNLYKCGDGLSDVHYLTWAPVRTASPDYHRPEFFVPVTFE